MKNLFNTPEQIATAIVILELAKRLIEDKKEEFVCIAVKEVSTLYIESDDARYDRDLAAVGMIIADHIEELLGIHSTVCVWLLRVHDINLDYDQIRQYRIQWIESMIKELQ